MPNSNRSVRKLAVLQFSHLLGCCWDPLGWWTLCEKKPFWGPL